MPSSYIRQTSRTTVLALAAVALLSIPAVAPLAAQGAAAPAPAAAPAAVTPAQAKAFLGDWSVSADGPQGAITFALSLKDADGKVAGKISSDMSPEQAITDVSKDGDTLVLRYSLDFQGNAVPVALTLSLSGEKLNVAFDFAAGQFQLTGVGTRKK